MKNILVLVTFLFGCSAVAESAKQVSICSTLRKATEKGTPAQKMEKYFSAQWKYTMTEYPEWATYAGYPGQNDRWTDESFEAIARRKNETVCALDILKKIPAAGLKGEEKINYDLAKRNLEEHVEGNRFPHEYLQIDHMDGFQIGVPDMIASMPRATKADYENILSRLDKLPGVEQQTEALLREGLKKHVTAVKMFLSRVPAQFDKALPAKIEDGPMYEPFKEITADISADDKKALQARALEVLKTKVYPAMQKLKGFVITEYIPGAREGIALSDMPDGKAWYAYLVKKHTTTAMTPDQLHDLGVKEVARISQEMEKIRAVTKFKGDLKEFNKFLLKDKQFFYKDKEALMVGYRDIAKRIDPELPKVFKTLPRLTYGVREMPDYKAADAPAAYYMGGSLEAGRPGYFEANTSDLPGRPKWGMEVLTLHEAVPGHHLQISIAQELKGLPDFRKQGGYTAFVEGWGLYAEGLGDQLGLYKNPYSQYGQLSYEMWRAIRLVVDTGMHSKGWTRQQSIDYFNTYMPKAQTEVENEVDRYIAMPGQALAYKVGQLKFVEMREKAKTELGDKFDVREFHEEILRHGALPMDVLEKSVSAWIDVQKKAKTKKIKDRV